jgi:hypothetical protein
MRWILISFAGLILGLAAGGMYGNQLGNGPEWSIATESPSEENPAKEKLETAPLSENSPKIQIGEKIYDFGILEGDQGGQHDFVVKNVGKSPLILKLGDKSCSCTDVFFSAKRLSPGQEGKITLKWENHQSIKGSFRHGASILTNDPENQEFILNIVGNYSVPISAVPSKILMQGVMAGMTNSARFRLYGFESAPLEVQGVEWEDKEHFTIEITKSELTESEKENVATRGAKSVYDGKITLEPGLPLGYFRERFRLVTNSEADRSFSIPLEGQIIGGNLRIISPNYHSEKGILEMGRTSRGTPIEMTAMIQFTPQGDAPAEFTVKSIQPEWLKASFGEITGEGSVRIIPLTVEVPADANLGTFLGPEPEQYGQIMIQTNLPDMNEIRFPVSFVVDSGK